MECRWQHTDTERERERERERKREREREREKEREKNRHKHTHRHSLPRGSPQESYTHTHKKRLKFFRLPRPGKPRTPLTLHLGSTDIGRYHSYVSRVNVCGRMSSEKPQPEWTENRNSTVTVSPIERWGWTP